MCDAYKGENMNEPFKKEREIRERICRIVIREMSNNYQGDLLGFVGAKGAIEMILRRAEKQMRSKNKIDIHELI